MIANVSVRRVASAADKKAFLGIPWKVYKNDPDWVPPLVSMRREKLEPEKSDVYAHLDIEYFVAWRGEEAVGCIAAFINHHHNDFHNDHIGWFGLFDVIDDEEAALALLSTAEEWVKAKGYDSIRGPASFGDLDEFGLQVDGFGDPHAILMPYNPVYYQGFVEKAGLAGIMDLVSYHIPTTAVQGQNVPEKITRVLAKVRKRRNINIRQPDRKHFSDDLHLMIEMYKEAWNDNWGFVPPTDPEMESVVDTFLQFVEPEFVKIAEIEGVPAGFIVLLPDINQAIKPAYPRPGKPELWSMLHILWHWKIRRKITRTRVPLLGVLPKFQGLGIDAMLYMSVVDAVVDYGITDGDFGWVLDNNLAMNQISDLIKGELYKRYRVYHKNFDGSPAEAIGVEDSQA